jgi:hypothetical protein
MHVESETETGAEMQVAGVVVVVWRWVRWVLLGGGGIVAVVVVVVVWILVIADGNAGGGEMVQRGVSPTIAVRSHSAYITHCILHIAHCTLHTLHITHSYTLHCNNVQCT